MKPRLRLVGAGMLFMAVVEFTTGCKEIPTLLDKQEDALGISSNFWGADHREFHRVLHYPNGVGLRFPGYVIGIEKGHQDKVRGPKVDPDLLDLPKDIDPSKVQRRLLSDPKAHFISHVIRYRADGQKFAVYPNRMRSCVLYSALPAVGRIGGEDKDATWGLFSYCDGMNPDGIEAGDGGDFERGWSGVKVLRDRLGNDLTPPKDKKQMNGEKEKPPYSHILVIVMGWNTPQGEALQNFNSIVGHLLDEVDERRRILSNNKDDKDYCRTAPEPECRFRPLVIGVTWASDWEISPLMPLPPALVRGISFPNKASDAEEVGITWLRAVIQHAVLPARNGMDTSKPPKVVLIGHSFGARAIMFAITEERALNTKRRLAEEVSVETNFRPGDTFISLQGAFLIEELFIDKKKNALHPSVVKRNLRIVLTASEFDSAANTAFWGTYAGSTKAYDKICKGKTANAYTGFIDCAKVVPLDPTLTYGHALCNTPFTERDPVERRNNRPILFIDASAVINCRAAFTGGGSHNDIYRRETASFLWDLIR